MNTFITLTYNEPEKKTFTYKRENVEFEHNLVNVISISCKKIEKTNDLKFFKVNVEFSTGTTKEFVVPSYVKFYSLFRGLFVPVEFVRNKDILIDYSGNIVKVEDTIPIPDFKMTNFYSIIAKYEVPTNIDLNEYSKRLNDCNFYLNGILTTISYNNFQKK